MDQRAKLDGILDASRIRQLRNRSAIVLDVDDTVLAREREGIGQESFEHSASASLLPELLQRGFRMCFITGHGWSQLESRLIKPLLEQLDEQVRVDAIKRLYIYANRGATRISWDGRSFAVSENYSGTSKLESSDLQQLKGLLESLGAEVMEDVRRRPDWYQANFPGFDFKQLPPETALREDTVLVLRPIPSAIHAKREEPTDIRANTYGSAMRQLQELTLNEDYEVAQAGRSSIEITRKGVSKDVALRDLISGISATPGDEDQVEESLVYIGDEFFPGGNDFAVARDFPGLLCFSVAERVEPAPGSAKVVNLPVEIGLSGTLATEALLKHVLDLSL